MSRSALEFHQGVINFLSPTTTTNIKSPPPWPGHFNESCPRRFDGYVFSIFFLGTDNEDPAPEVEGKDIDPAELLEVSAEHENQESSADKPDNGLVNEITKQQMIVQFLKVTKFSNLTSVKARR